MTSLLIVVIALLSTFGNVETANTKSMIEDKKVEYVQCVEEEPEEEPYVSDTYQKYLEYNSQRTMYFGYTAEEWEQLNAH